MIGSDRSGTPSEEERSSSAFHAIERKVPAHRKSYGSQQLFIPTEESKKSKEVKGKNSKGFQPLSNQSFVYR